MRQEFFDSFWSELRKEAKGTALYRKLRRNPVAAGGAALGLAGGGEFLGNVAADKYRAHKAKKKVKTPGNQTSQ